MRLDGAFLLWISVESQDAPYNTVERERGLVMRALTFGTYPLGGEQSMCTVLRLRSNLVRLKVKERFSQ